MEINIDTIRKYQTFIDKELMGTSDRILDFAITNKIEYEVGARMLMDSAKRLSDSLALAYEETKSF